MKKIATMFVCVTFVLFSCTNENESFTIQTAEISENTSDEYSNFMASVDSVNLQFANPTRGLFGLSWSSIADFAGRWIGNKAGGYVGAAIGGVTGNPVASVVGYLAGNKYGGGVGAMLCSSVVGFFSGDYIVSTPVKDGVVVSSGISNLLYADSMGIYHNQAMVQISKNLFLYKTKDGKPNYDLLFDDCVKFMVNDLASQQTLLNDTTFRQSLILFAEQTLDKARKCARGEISADSFLMDELHLIVDNENVELDTIEQKLFVDFGRKVLETSQGLSYSEMEEYAQSLSDVIKKSSLTEELKNDAASSADILNSTICWQ